MKSVFVSKAVLAAVVGALLCSSGAFAKEKACSDKSCGSSHKECAKKDKATQEPKAADTKADAAKVEEKPAK